VQRAVFVTDPLQSFLWNNLALPSPNLQTGFWISFAFCSEFLVSLLQHQIASGFIGAHIELTPLSLPSASFA